MRAAVQSPDDDPGRLSPLGDEERLDAASAAAALSGRLPRAGRLASRRIAVGETADLCILKTPLNAALERLDRDLVAATVVAGRGIRAR